MMWKESKLRKISETQEFILHMRKYVGLTSPMEKPAIGIGEEGGLHAMVSKPCACPNTVSP